MTPRRSQNPAGSVRRDGSIVVLLAVLALLAVPVLLLALLLGFLPRWHRPDSTQNHAMPAPLEVPLQPPTQLDEIVGRVTTTEGELATRVPVMLLGPGAAFQVWREAVTDDRGAFSFAGVPPGVVRVTAHDETRGSALSAEVAVKAGEHVASLLLVLAPDKLVTGRVVDVAGEPVANARVAPEGFPWIHLSTEVDAAGTFTLPRVARMVTGLRASAAGFVPEVVAIAPDPPVGQPLVVTLRLRRAPPLEGVVLTADEHPVAGATVTACDEHAERWQAQAGADGVFQLPAVAAGCPLVAAHPRYAPSRSVLMEPGSRPVLRLGSGGGLAGVVADENGSPISSFFVGVEAFFPAVGSPRALAREAKNLVKRVADSKGTFSFDSLAPGTYVLVARAEGYAPVISASTDVRSGERTEGVTIALARGATLEGRLVDPVRGVPLAGVSVSLDTVATSLPAASAAVKTDANGYFHVTGVPSSSPVSLRMEAPDGGLTLMTGLQASVLAAAVLPTYALASLARTRVRYDGIGARLTQLGADIVVLDVKKGGPADREGLRAGDVVRAVNDSSVGRLPLSEVVQKLRGRAGTEVEIRVRGEGVSGEKELQIMRERIEDDVSLTDVPV